MSVAAIDAVRLDVSALTGTWNNTNRDSRGIVQFIVEDRQSCLSRLPGQAGLPVLHIQAFGLTPWPSVPATVYGDRLDTREAMAFSAVVDLGYCDVHLQANIKGGVLVVASFNRFKDGSGRSSYFTREFYYRVR